MNARETVYESSVPEYIDQIKQLQRKQEYAESLFLQTYEEALNNYASELDEAKLTMGRRYLEALLEDKTLKITNRTPKYFFRGHYKTNYQLVPSVYRESESPKERYYYHEMAVRSPKHLKERPT